MQSVSVFGTDFFQGLSVLLQEISIFTLESKTQEESAVLLLVLILRAEPDTTWTVSQDTGPDAMGRKLPHH